MTLRLSQCRECRYYRFSRNCRAFPERIPEEVFFGDVDHHCPYPGDHGVRFRSRQELEERRDQVPCFRCEHYRGDLECLAFLDGIPDAILDGEVDHTEPYPGDDGYQFTPTTHEISWW